MYNLINWYNQNRTKVWRVIVFGIIVILVFWRGMYIFSENKSRTQSNNNSIINQDDLNSISVSSEKSALTRNTISTSNKKIKTIDDFMTFCKTAKIQDAYNLLSNECKEEMYSNINIFAEMYYKPIFQGGNRNVNIENWYGDIYKIDFKEDYLATGRYDNSNTIRDFITVVVDSENNCKLNINKYIGRTEINKTGKTGDFEIKIIRKDSYFDYETYSFEIKNGYNHKVLIGKIEDEENVSYLQDKNGIKYNAVVSELSEADLLLYEKQTKTLKIKYYNQYSSTRKLKELVFPNIYLNYQVYENLYNKNNYTEYGNIKISL